MWRFGQWSKGGRSLPCPLPKLHCRPMPERGHPCRGSALPARTAAAAGTPRAMNMLAAMRLGRAACSGAVVLAACRRSAMPHRRRCPRRPGPEALDVVVIPGWLVPTGPQLRDQSTLQPALWRHAAGPPAAGRAGGRAVQRVQACWRTAACWRGARRRCPGCFAPSIVLQSSESGAKTADVAEVIWQRERTCPARWRPGPRPRCRTPGGHAGPAGPRHRQPSWRRPHRTRCCSTPAPADRHHRYGDPYGPPWLRALERARRWLQDHRNEPTACRPRPAPPPPARAPCCAGLPRCMAKHRRTTCTGCALPRPRRCCRPPTSRWTMGAAMRLQRHGQFRKVFTRVAGDARGLPPALPGCVHRATSSGWAAGAAWRRRAGVGRPTARRWWCLRQRRGDNDALLLNQ